MAVEAIVLSASKKDKAAGILAQGADILQNLSQSANEEIRLLALVVRRFSSSFFLHFRSFRLGLSENRVEQRDRRQWKFDERRNVSTVGEIVLPVSIRKSCEGNFIVSISNRFLTSSENFTSRRWAADGIAYLSLDADVKEEFVTNLPALKALFQLSQCDDNHVLYSILTIFVNLTNSYDVQKAEKEMLELAAYAKQHIPKEHPKDEKSFVDERRRKLVEAGIIPVLVQLCKQKSENCRELISR